MLPTLVAHLLHVEHDQVSALLRRVARKHLQKAIIILRRLKKGLPPLFSKTAWVLLAFILFLQVGKQRHGILVAWERFVRNHHSSSLANELSDFAVHHLP